MAEIKVENMHCEKCVERISSLFEEEGLAFKVSLKDKTVTVEDEENKIEIALEALDDLGFTAEVNKSF